MHIQSLPFISFCIHYLIFVHATDINEKLPESHNFLYNGYVGLVGIINEFHQAIKDQMQTNVDQQQKITALEQKIDTQQKTIEKLPRFCRGRTSVNQWRPYATGIFVDVDTSSCQFEQVPTYFTSLSGVAQHWQITGMTSIYDETSTGFRVYLYLAPAAETANATIAALSVRKWELNWIGILQGE